MSNEPKVPTYTYSPKLSLFYKNRQAISMDTVCTELNCLESEVERLQSDLARCKAERLGAEDLYSLILMYDFIDENWYHKEDENGEHPMTTSEVITAFRASQQTQEGKG